MIRHLALLALSLCLSVSAFAGDPVPPGAKAPAFSLSDATGKTVTLAQFAGKTVVLEWVNFDCPFVKKHYSAGDMPKLQQKWTATGVVWLAINSSAPGKQGHFLGDALQARIAQEGAKPTHYLVDADGTVGKAYGAATTPQMVVIDGTGVVRYHGAIDSVRSTDASDIAGAINHVDVALTELAAGKPVSLAQTKSYGCSVKY
jgi:peroxiredoxin